MVSSSSAATQRERFERGSETSKLLTTIIFPSPTQTLWKRCIRPCRVVHLLVYIYTKWFALLSGQTVCRLLYRRGLPMWLTCSQTFACTVSLLYGERLQAACHRPLVCMHYVMDLVDREHHASSNPPLSLLPPPHNRAQFHLCLCRCIKGAWAMIYT